MWWIYREALTSVHCIDRIKFVRYRPIAAEKTSGQCSIDSATRAVCDPCPSEMLRFGEYLWCTGLLRYGGLVLITACVVVSWLITRFRNRIPGCWNRVTRIRLYYIFFLKFMLVYGRAALCNRAAINIYIFIMWFLLSFFFFSSPNLSGRRLDVYHTSTHGVALV